MQVEVPSIHTTTDEAQVRISLVGCLHSVALRTQHFVRHPCSVLCQAMSAVQWSNDNWPWCRCHEHVEEAFRDGDCELWRSAPDEYPFRCIACEYVGGDPVWITETEATQIQAERDGDAAISRPGDSMLVKWIFDKLLTHALEQREPPPPPPPSSEPESPVKKRRVKKRGASS